MGHGVGGRLDGDPVAGAGEGAQHQVEGLLGAAGDEDLVRRRGDAVGAQPLGDGLAQRQVALGVAVPQQVLPPGDQHALDGPAEVVGGAEVAIGHQAREVDEILTRAGTRREGQ